MENEELKKTPVEKRIVIEAISTDPQSLEDKVASVETETWLLSKPNGKLFSSVK